MYKSFEALQLAITQLCVEESISINKLAQLSGLPQSTVASIMDGRSKNPRIQTLQKISEGFGLDFDCFYKRVQEAQKKVDERATLDEPWQMATIPATYSDYAERLVKAREARGLTQEEFAVLLSVTVPELQDIEAGLVAPGVHSLILLSDALNISADYLLKGEEWTGSTLNENWQRPKP